MRKRREGGSILREREGGREGEKGRGRRGEEVNVARDRARGRAAFESRSDELAFFCSDFRVTFGRDFDE